LFSGAAAQDVAIAGGVGVAALGPDAGVVAGAIVCLPLVLLLLVRLLGAVPVVLLVAAGAVAAVLHAAVGPAAVAGGAGVAAGAAAGAAAAAGSSYSWQLGALLDRFEGLLGPSWLLLEPSIPP